MNKKFILYFSLFLSNLSLLAQNATDLIISEYCEYNHTITPQFYNHYIELYNGTGADVDMTQYQLWRSLNATSWNNNGGTPVTPLGLLGVLHDGETYVITRPNTSSNPISIANDSNQSWTFLNISGDDAIGLAKNDGSGNFVLIDLIGSETVDPGDGWTVAGIANATMNHTLVRKPNVCSPSTDWATSANDEWLVMPENDTSNIGQHTQDCNWTPSVGDTVAALFIGNSYTYYFDMPVIVQSLAASVGDVFIHDQNTIGGYTFEDHYGNATSRAKILSGNYDFLILQEQSTRPVRQLSSVESQTFPYATMLDSLRKVGNGCAETMFYRTWAHRYGYTSNCDVWPYPCTYEGMDSLLALRYGMMQEMNDALISPVGQVSRYIHDNHTEINLYDPDNSHPSAEGSYLSAVTFYAALFRKDPTLLTYDFSISAADAETIRNSVKLIFFDSIDVWNDYREAGEPCDTVQIDTTGSTGFNQINENLNWKLYPNPAKEKLMIESTSAVSSESTAALFNAQGQLVKLVEIQQQITQVALTDLTSGVYFIQLKNGDQTSVQKISVE